MSIPLPLFFKKIRHQKYLLIVPLVILYISIVVYPITNVVLTSFTRGAFYYQKLVDDFVFHHALRNTLVFAFGGLAIQLPLGFFVAMLLNQRLRGLKLIRTIITVPLTVSPVVSAAAFQLIASSQPYGLWNSLLALFGVSPVNWLAMPDLAMLTIIIANSWMFTPFSILVFLAALSSIPTEPYEAAKIDGASSIQTFIHITLPFMRPAIAIVLVLRMVQLFMFFDLPFLLTWGGPGYATLSLVMRIYTVAFHAADIGYANTVASATLYVLLVIAFVFFRYLRPERGVS